MIITPDGINSLRYGYGDPNFNDTGIPFASWMAANHPEDKDAVGFSKWTSPEEAEQNGILTAQYVETWAAYLGAKGCVYTDGC